MQELKSICFELLAKYASEKAWIAECFCRNDSERADQARKDQSELLSYKNRIEKALSKEDEFIGLTD